MNQRFNTRAVVEAGIAIALSFILDRIKLFEMPQGGTVTAGSMIPILFIALRHGTAVGMTAGAAFGMLQMFFGGYVVHPVQAILDYPLAFACLGLAGLWPKRAWLGAPLAVAGRFLCHVLSGVVFFAEYAKDQNVWVYSIVYNASYLLPELAVSAILLTLLFMHPAMRALRSQRSA